MEEVRLSRAWRAVGSVAAGRTVAWWAFILGRGRVRREGVDVVGVVVFEEEEEVWVVDVVAVSEVVGVSVVEGGFGIVVPVRADQMSSIGGVGSDHGTVKRGLSHLLIVVGSS